MRPEAKKSRVGSAICKDARGVRSRTLARLAGFAVFTVSFVLAGCGGGTTIASTSGGSFSISPGTTTIDTNCVGCNAKNSSGSPVEQFSVTTPGGTGAAVTWSVSGGDANSGHGKIDAATGQYTPPSYLTANSVQVTITAALTSNPTTTVSTVLTITPGFLQPLTPENSALGANGTLTLAGYIAEAGGTSGINFALSNTASGSSGGQGTLGTPTCIRGGTAFTHCSVVYSAPAIISSTNTTYIVATVGTSTSKSASVVLLNTAVVTSNPATH
jgi:hypothetical protein